MELLLTDEQAQHLIKIFKTTLKRHEIYLSENSNGIIILKSFEGKHEFTLRYHFSLSKKTIHFMDNDTKHTLFRVHLSNGFHKNADGEKVFGNRINIFSEEEFYAKRAMGDSFTHYKCFPLPFENISNTDDFFELFNSVCQFANIEKQDNIIIELANQETLF
ncbi:hypothetical protein CYR81_00270 [Enterococcus faecalis]|uniref:DUF6978 family protein n=1 Tax=Enterococcus faecalis TaxID=1351 RepID=UPI000C792FEC|nr:hypothetical protein [Enterococcus faecalis]PLA82124.1 hypothetical protein CYR81_00270 [Enterococcus faecalis]HCT1441602.1 hypothetical protein [Enterococcus faecalis]